MLAAALAARGRMRLSYDGGRTYPPRLERALPAEPPPCPAAVHIYDDMGTTRLLAADFDVKRAAARGAADAVGQVTADAMAFAALIQSCGGRGFGDISPNGGRHGYVLWSAPVPFAEMRRVALALASRYPSLDPLPMLGRQNGIIRPPGSRHRSGGVQLLTTPLQHALRCAREPNGPSVWNRLCEALRGELQALDDEALLPGVPAEAAPEDARWRVDEAGVAWLPRPSGRISRLRPDLELTAISGGYDTRRYPTPSEARYAVLCSAAARGWRLAEVTTRMSGGTWQGLAGFYARYRHPAQQAKALAADWRKAVAAASGEKSGRASTTSEIQHSAASRACRNPETLAELEHSGVGEYQQIRQWENAYRSAERQRWPGAHGITVRLVIRALGAAAQMTGSMVIEWGVRSLAMLTGVDHSTVARILAELRDEEDPFVVRLADRRGLRADLYMLRIPKACVSAAAWRRWRPGRIGVHPVFRVLGAAAALVLEQLTSEPVRTTDLPQLTGLSPTAVSTALARLAAEAIAVRHSGGWSRGPADLDQVADRLGVPDMLAATVARYRQEREQWRARLGRHGAPGTPLRPVQAPPGLAPGGQDGVREPAAARAPPAADASIAAAITELEAVLGPVRIVAA